MIVAARAPAVPLRRALAAAAALLAGCGAVPGGGALVAGDAMPEPLTAVPGDPARGRAIVASREQGLCLLCHRGPFPDPHLQGDLASDLAGAGRRWSVAQLRLRIVDPRRLDPRTPMPAYGRSGGERVAAAFRDRPILTPQQIEDVVAFLATLRE